MEWDAHLLWNHGGRHVSQNTPVNVWRLFLALCLLPVSVLSGRQKADSCLQRISSHLSPSQDVLYTVYSLYPISLSFSVFPPLSFIPYLTLSSHHSCPENVRALKFKPSLPLCLPFHSLPFPLFKLLWQIEVRLNTPGCFNFIDPPLEVTKAVNCFCLRMKLCHSSR